LDSKIFKLNFWLDFWKGKQNICIVSIRLFGEYFADKLRKTSCCNFTTLIQAMFLLPHGLNDEQNVFPISKFHFSQRLRVNYIILSLLFDTLFQIPNSEVDVMFSLFEFAKKFSSLGE